jgi:UDP-N-acetylglucosamine 2-epimerase (non-hydrolysing)
MPEEKNRIIADHLSDAIYCYLDRYRQILLSEGIPAFRVAVVGNVIVDAVNSFLPMAEKRLVLQQFGVQEKQYVLCTLHREENLESAEILDSKLRGLRELSMTMPVVFPLMPRLDAGIKRFGLQKLLADPQLILTKPLGYLEFLKLEKHARMIITDSGTVQEEALILGVPCVVTRRSTERPETIAAGATILADEDLVTSAHRALNMDAIWDRDVLNPMGGSPSERIYQDLVDKIRSGFFSTSRNFDMLSENRFARQAYGLDLQNTSSSFRTGSAVPELSLMNSF